MKTGWLILAAVASVPIGMGILIAGVMSAARDDHTRYKAACDHVGGQVVHNGRHYECLSRR